MACNCKVNQQIDYLHKKYGDNIPQNKKTNIRGSIMAYIENSLIFFLLIPFVPFMGFYALYNIIVGKTMHLDKFFKKV